MNNLKLTLLINLFSAALTLASPNGMTLHCQEREGEKYVELELFLVYPDAGMPDLHQWEGMLTIARTPIGPYKSFSLPVTLKGRLPLAWGGYSPMAKKDFELDFSNWNFEDSNSVKAQLKIGLFETEDYLCKKLN